MLNPNRPWSALSRAAWLAFAVHLAAGLAMALILRRGLETNPDLPDRLRFVSGHRALWTAGWICWTLAGPTILGFYSRFVAAHRFAGALPASSSAVVPLAIAAVGADWSAQAVEVLVLPGFAGAADVGGFLAWHRAAVVLTGFLANGLYTASALLLVWAARSSYPRWIRDAGFGVVIGGTALSAAAWADSAAGMLWANVLLVPCLLLWLAGVALAAGRRRG